MGKIPPEIARFRKPGTQIKRINGRYYLARVTSRWDPAAKKVRKVFLEHLGTVTADGVSPKRTVRRPVKEFVEAEFKQHRYAFSAKRKTCARGIGICENWDGVRLHSARRLQKAPVTVTA